MCLMLLWLSRSLSGRCCQRHQRLLGVGVAKGLLGCRQVQHHDIQPNTQQCPDYYSCEARACLQRAQCASAFRSFAHETLM